jgi:hypothetical protein
MAKERIVIEGDRVLLETPEGAKVEIPVSELHAALRPPRMDTGDVVLADGVKSVLGRGHVAIWIHETPPRIHNFKWIARDSEAPYGPATKYREVRIALPYLIVFAVYARGPQGFHLTAHNECFFRVEPFRDPSDSLLYPALLNCSKFSSPDGHPLAWICTQHLNTRTTMRMSNENDRMRAEFKLLMACLLDSGFNFSSEHHEGTSWFTESTGVDPRIATVERWQEESEKNAFFALDVPWIQVGMSVAQAAERIASNLKASDNRVATASDIARLVTNRRRPTRRRSVKDLVGLLNPT